MKKKILFITRGKDDPSTRYRVAPLIPLLAESGWSVRQLSRHSKFLRSRMLLASLSGQTIFIQRKLFGVFFLRLLSMCPARVIFDFDDAVFVKRSGKDDRKTLRRFQRTIEISSLVLAGNRYLARKANEFSRNGKVCIAPTGIDCEKYARAVPNFGNAKQLVWIGAQSTQKYLEQASEALSSIAKAVPDIELKIIADFEWKHPDIQVTCAPWSEETEAEELKGCLAGIAPMSDTPWTRGKCGLKVLQYMAAGLPVIASNTGVHPDMITNLKNGFLVCDSQGWKNSARTLSSDAMLRKQMADSAQAMVSKNYDISTVSAKICKTVNSLHT